MALERPYPYFGPSLYGPVQPGAIGPPGATGPPGSVPSSTQRVDDWDAAEPLVLELLAAGHTPGVYLLAAANVAGELPSSGTLARVWAWGEYWGAVECSAPPVDFATAAASTLWALAYSGGVDPITLTLTPDGVTGSPHVAITAAACLLLPP